LPKWVAAVGFVDCASGNKIFADKGLGKIARRPTGDGWGDRRLPAADGRRAPAAGAAGAAAEALTARRSAAYD
jgi:hypothetical protein